MYWAIATVTTVGFGDITPKTDLGRAIASFIMLLGWGILAVPTGIVTPPTRRFDIAIEEDLIEEVIRVIGYDALAPLSPVGALTPRSLTVTGIADAYMDSTPIVVITGQVPTSMIGSKLVTGSNAVVGDSVTLTASVRTKPAYLPAMNCARLTGLDSSA